MKFKTVREGEEAVVFNHMGDGKHIVGPQRVFLFRERLSYLRQYTANQYQYLVVTDNYGLTKHHKGPCTMFCNPLEHQSIEVRTAMKIDANHSVVVYEKLKDNTVQRRIVQGPTVFVPQAEEWVHEFKWHGPDPQDKGHMIAGLSVLKQLPCISDQFYYNVRDVRTNDDTMLTVKLMIFYQLHDIITMLEATHDPIADMINAVCSDIISFSGVLSYEQFLEKSQKLSELSSYPQLLQRAQRIGYSVSKVVYRGYTASTQMQAMQDSAIQERTKLWLNVELEKQKSMLEDYKLQKEQARTNLRHEMERSKVGHAQEMERQQQQHKLHLAQLENTSKMQCQSLSTQAKLESEKEANEFQEYHMQQLHDLDVDVTQYLVSRLDPAADQEIQICNPASRIQTQNPAALIQNRNPAALIQNHNPAPIQKALSPNYKSPVAVGVASTSTLL